MLGILVGMDQKDSYAARLLPRSSSTTSVACSPAGLLVCTYSVFPSLVGKLAMPGIMVGPVEVLACAETSGRSPRRLTTVGS